MQFFHSDFIKSLKEKLTTGSFSRLWKYLNSATSWYFKIQIPTWHWSFHYKIINSKVHSITIEWNLWFYLPLLHLGAMAKHVTLCSFGNPDQCYKLVWLCLRGVQNVIQCCSMTIYHLLLLEWVRVTKYQSTLADSRLVIICRNIEKFQNFFFPKNQNLWREKKGGIFWYITSWKLFNYSRDMCWSCTCTTLTRHNITSQLISSPKYPACP